MHPCKLALTASRAGAAPDSLRCPCCRLRSVVVQSIGCDAPSQAGELGEHPGQLLFRTTLLCGDRRILRRQPANELAHSGETLALMQPQYEGPDPALGKSARRDVGRWPFAADEQAQERASAGEV